MTNQEKITEFMVAAKQDIPTTITPMSDDVRRLRAHLILEECLETIVKGLGITNIVNENSFDVNLEGLLEDMNVCHFEITRPQNLIEIADGIADMEYVNTGTAVACGIDIQPIFDEVHRSNMSKFIDGIFREDGKYQKGPSYSKADVEGVLLAQHPLCLSCGLRHPNLCGV